jgi:hypothetical protein
MDLEEFINLGPDIINITMKDLEEIDINLILKR